MQVNNSLNTNAIIPAQSGGAQKGAKAVGTNKTEQSAKPLSAQGQLVTSEKAIAFIEREQSHKANQHAFYDRPSKQNRSAVATYQSIDNQAQRENVQSMLGVDLFA